MFQDREDELKRLEKELLDSEQPDPFEEEEYEDDWEEPDEEESPQPGEYHGRYEARNTDLADADMDAYASAVEQEDAPQSLRGLMITALCLLGGILGILVYWIFRYLG